MTLGEIGMEPTAALLCRLCPAAYMFSRTKLETGKELKASLLKGTKGEEWREKKTFLTFFAVPSSKHS